MAEQDVKDASAGVLKDLKRFQLEKEDDLRRYMVSSCSATLPASANALSRLPTPNVTLIGPRRTSRLGERPRKRLRKSMCGRIRAGIMSAESIVFGLTSRLRKHGRQHGRQLVKHARPTTFHDGAVRDGDSFRFARVQLHINALNAVMDHTTVVYQRTDGDSR